jgi:hypothetical protein
MGADCPLVIVNAVIDITSPVPGYSAITPARTPLLKGGPEGHQLLAVLVNLGLKLTELFKLGPLRPHGGEHCGPLSLGPRGQSSLKWSVDALSYGGGVPMGNLVNLYVKAFTRRVVILPIGVRATEEIVARAHEPA